MKEYETKKGFLAKEYDNTLSVVDCITKREYYRFLVYDTTRGMNIGNSDESEIDALFNALKYYQNRLLHIEGELDNLQNKVNNFINSVAIEEE
jgi:hypothetical protein